LIHFSYNLDLEINLPAKKIQKAVQTRSHFPQGIALNEEGSGRMFTNFEN